MNKKIPSLNGLILIGGKSTRMGSDKNKINYHGKTQLEHVFNMLNKHIKSSQLYYSIRNKKQLSKSQTIEDQYEGFGPFGAICSAFLKNKKTAWLVIANDLPYVDEKLISLLISKRNPNKIATTFKGKNKKYPEPLITIWEPKSYAILEKYLVQKKLSLINVLKNNEVQIIEIDDELIQNINTIEEYNKIKQKFSSNN